MAYKYSRRYTEFDNPAHKGVDDNAYMPMSAITAVSQVPVRDIHINELRTYLDQMRIARYGSTFSWSDFPVVAGYGNTSIRAAHINQIRANIAAFDPAYSSWTGAPGTSTTVRGIHIDELRNAIDGISNAQVHLAMSTAVLGVMGGGAGAPGSRVEIQINFAEVVQVGYFNHGDPIFAFTPTSGSTAVLPNIPSFTVPTGWFSGSTLTIDPYHGLFPPVGYTYQGYGTDSYRITITNYPEIAPITSGSITITQPLILQSVVSTSGYSFDSPTSVTLTITLDTTNGRGARVGDVFTITSSAGAASMFSAIRAGGGTYTTTLSGLIIYPPGLTSFQRTLTADQEQSNEVLTVHVSSGSTVQSSAFNYSAELRATSLTLIETTLNGIPQLTGGYPATIVTPGTGITYDYTAATFLDASGWIASTGSPVRLGAESPFPLPYSGSGSYSTDLSLGGGFTAFKASLARVCQIPIHVGTAQNVGTSITVSFTINLNSHSAAVFVGIIPSSLVFGASPLGWLNYALYRSWDENDNTTPSYGVTFVAMYSAPDIYAGTPTSTAGGIVSGTPSAAPYPEQTNGNIVNLYNTNVTGSRSDVATLTLTAANTLHVGTQHGSRDIDLTGLNGDYYICVVASVSQAEVWQAAHLSDIQMGINAFNIVSSTSGTVYPVFKYRAALNKNADIGDQLVLSSDLVVASGPSASIMSDLRSSPATGKVVTATGTANYWDFPMQSSASGGPETVCIRPISSLSNHLNHVEANTSVTVANVVIQNTHGNVAVSKWFWGDTGYQGNGLATEIEWDNLDYNPATSQFIPGTTEHYYYSPQVLEMRRACCVFPVKLSKTGTSTLTCTVGAKCNLGIYTGRMLIGVFQANESFYGPLSASWLIANTPTPTDDGTYGYKLNPSLMGIVMRPIGTGSAFFAIRPNYSDQFGTTYYGMNEYTTKEYSQHDPNYNAALGNYYTDPNFAGTTQLCTCQVQYSNDALTCTVSGIAIGGGPLSSITHTFPSLYTPYGSNLYFCIFHNAVGGGDYTALSTMSTESWILPGLTTSITPG